MRALVQARGGEIVATEPKGRMELPSWLRRANGGVEVGQGRRTINALVPQRVRSRLRHALLHFRVGDLVPVRYCDYEKYAERALESSEFDYERAAIARCDVVVVNGEGSIYDRQRKGRMILFLAYIAHRYFNKAVCIVNHTADLADPFTREAALSVYPTLDDIVFREALSAAQFAGVGRFDVAGDAAFSYSPSDELTKTDLMGHSMINGEEFDPNRPYVCIGGSSIYLRPDRPDYDPTSAYIELARRLKRRYGQVVLTASCAIDEELFYRVIEKSPMPLMTVSTPVQHAVDVLSRALCYVSGRWHPSIFALVGGTPIVMLTANTFKTAGLMQQCELEGPIFDALRLHTQLDDIIETTEQLVCGGESLRTRLRTRANTLRQGVDRHVRFLATSHGGA